MTNHSVYSFSCPHQSVAQNKNDSVSQFNDNIYRVSDSSYAWKIFFNQGSSEQSKELMFVQMRKIRQIS